MSYFVWNSLLSALYTLFSLTEATIYHKKYLFILVIVLSFDTNRMSRSTKTTPKYIYKIDHSKTTSGPFTNMV